MTTQISRRAFVKGSLLATAAVPLTLQTQSLGAAEEPAQDAMPKGRMGGQEFSRLMLGGNLISGYSHARDLSYVSPLMRRYNTPAKIRETLELAEAQGITAMNTWVQDDNSQLFAHWKNGGRMKWFAQARMDAEGGFTQFQRAMDEGAAGVHVNGDAAEMLLHSDNAAQIGEAVQLVKSQKRVAGVAAHDLRVLEACEKLKVEADFYQKTFHSHEYYSAPRAEEKGALGDHDNSWCNDPQAVVNFMAGISKPWIAFKVLAAGAIPPRAAFPYAFNSGADFILVGMFDWQIAENAALARRVIRVAQGPNTRRIRKWCG